MRLRNSRLRTTAGQLTKASSPMVVRALGRLMVVSEVQLSKAKSEMVTTDSGNVMAYVSSWGEANPGGGQSEIERYLKKSRKEVEESAALLKQIIDALGLDVKAA